MKKIALILSTVFAISLISSCDKAEKTGLGWGKTDYYEDSFLMKYKPVIMTQTLAFDFNDTAKERFAGEEFEFRLMEFSSELGEKVVAENIKVYKNGELCHNNEFIVTPDESLVEIGIEFLPNASTGEHLLYLDLSSTDILDETECEFECINIEKNDIMNPANKILMWILIVLATCYIVWLIVLRPILAPHVRFSSLYITYPGTNDQVQTSTYGCTKVVLTNKPIKQCFLNRVFMTKYCVVVNEVWTTPVTIKSKNRHDLRISGGVDYTPDEVVRQETFTIITEEGTRVDMDTN